MPLMWSRNSRDCAFINPFAVAESSWKTSSHLARGANRRTAANNLIPLTECAIIKPMLPHSGFLSTEPPSNLGRICIFAKINGRVDCLRGEGRCDLDSDENAPGKIDRDEMR